MSYRRTSRDNGLGYPSQCIYLQERIGRRLESFEPTGYSSVEVDHVGQCVHGLRLMRKLAVMRYCKPWMAHAIEVELGRSHDTDTWLYHLKLGLAEVVDLMDRDRHRMVEKSAVDA